MKEKEVGKEVVSPQHLEAVDVDKAISAQWTKSDRELIWRTVAPKTTAPEFKLFLYIAHKFNLDPLTREVWCVKYKDSEPAQIFTGRDGFLKIAHEHKAFDGMETVVEKTAEPLKITTYIKGREHVEERDWQYKATCTVWRKDMSHPFSVTIWEEEYNRLNEPWRNKPRTMLQKVAESQALRKAFSIHGLYAEEEGWAENKVVREGAVEVESREVALISDVDRKRIHAKAAEKGYTHEDIKKLIAKKPYNYASTNDILVKDLEFILAAIDKWKEKPKPAPKKKTQPKPKEKKIIKRDEQAEKELDMLFAEAGIKEDKKKLMKRQYFDQPGGLEKLRSILNGIIDQNIIGEGDGIIK